MLIVAAFIVALVYKLIRPNLDTSVPLQLCDVAELTAAYALWSQRHWAFVLTYYWGLVLSSQALITPDIGTPEEARLFPPPSFRHVLHASRPGCVGGHLSDVGPSQCARDGATTASRSSRPSHGRPSPSPLT